MSLFRSEWKKVTGWRATWVILGVMVLLVIIQQLVFAFLARRAPTASDFVSMPGLSTSMIAMMFGAFVLATEHTRGSATTLYVATPHRIKVIIAKVKVVIFLLIPTVVVLVGIGTAGALLYGAKDTNVAASLGAHHLVTTSLTVHEVLRSLVGAEISCVIGAFLGIGIAALIRNTTACLGAIAGFFIIIDNLLGLWNHWPTFSLNTAVQRLN